MDDKLLKQQFLKDNIMGGGYDPNEFGKFMASQKEDGTNIENWDLDELELLVDTFKRLYKTFEPEKHEEVDSFKSKHLYDVSDDDTNPVEGRQD